MTVPRRRALASDKVRFVGDPVAVVIADSALRARDAAETVVLDVEVLPAVTRVAEAVAPGAPQLYSELPENRVLDYHFGDGAAVAAAFAGAAHVTKLALTNNRIVVNAMEPRAAVAAYDAASGRYTLHAPSQGVFGKRNNLADAMGVAHDRMHLVTGHVGGSFGMKGSVFPEYVCLMHAARELGRPVKWTDLRSDSFSATITAATWRWWRNWRSTPTATSSPPASPATAISAPISRRSDLMMTTLNIAKNAIGMYRTPLTEVNTTCAVTNTVPIGAYRGAGRPEGNYYMERLIDAAAAELGVDKVDLRRRNMVRPDQFPWATPAGMNYDSGDFPGSSTARWWRPTGTASRRGARRAGSAGCCADAASVATWR